MNNGPWRKEKSSPGFDPMSPQKIVMMIVSHMIRMPSFSSLRISIQAKIGAKRRLTAVIRGNPTDIPAPNIPVTNEQPNKRAAQRIKASINQAGEFTLSSPMIS